MKENRYSWQRRPNNHHDYYNEYDFDCGNYFIVVDNLTHKRHEIKPINRSLEPLIPEELQNQEFMNFACQTSPTFSRYVNSYWMTEELIDIALKNTIYSPFISRVPKELLTKKRCLKAVSHNPGFLEYIPDSLINYDICLEAVRSVSKESNLKFFYQKIPRNFITFEIASLLIQKNSSSISFIDEKFITEETYFFSLKDNVKNIKYIPENRITKEMASFVLEKDITLVNHIPSIYLTEDILEKIIIKDSRLLKKIEESLISEKLITVALENGIPLGSIPIKFRTYEICKRKVLENNSMIRSVPVFILTKEFYEEIIALGVTISLKNMLYVKECLKVNEKYADNKEEKKSIKKENYEEYKDIRLESIENFFFMPTINFFNRNGIFTLQDLFIRYDDPSFLEIFSFSKFSQTVSYHRIDSMVKILKCKYRNEDPHIDFDSDLKEVLNKMGLEVLSFHILNKNFQTVTDLFETLKSPDAYDILSGFKKAGKGAVMEILNKFHIIEKYYDLYKQAKDTLAVSKESLKEKEYLNYLLQELERLENEKLKLDSQINRIKLEIEEKKPKKDGVTL